MNIFLILISLIGGLAFFLFGMHLMSGSLEKMTGGKLESLLKKMTANPLISLLLGAAITIAMQSSSATTVMLVGLVNSGILEFSKTLYLCFGANIGTTLTAWILGLSGIDSNNLFLQLLKPSNFSPILALIGVLLVMVSKKNTNKSIGTVFLGFAILMAGMDMMSDAMSPLAEQPWFVETLGHFQSAPIMGLLLMFVFTAIIQSSAASIGILQALSIAMVGTATPLTYGMVFPMVMGLNIGTCATSLISSIGTNTGAKRVAFSHLLFNLLGTLICLPLFLLGDAIFQWEFVDQAVDPWGIALLHTVFNIVVTVTLMPFTKLIVKFIEWLIRDKKKVADEDEQFCVLDERLLKSPAFAIAECKNFTQQMNELACDTLKTAIANLYQYNEETAERILKQEDRLDIMEDRMGTYLVRISAEELSHADSQEVSKILHTIGDFERLGDHAVNLLKTSKEMYDKSITFSEEAKRELEVLTAAALEILEITSRSFREQDLELAGRVEPLEQVIDKLIAEIKDHHINRLRAGNCTIELGFVLSDLLTNYSRISDHCSNIAVALIEVEHDSFDTHSYLNAIKYGNQEFNQIFEAYADKYEI